VPDLEHAIRPPLAIPLSGGQPVRRDRKRLVVAVEHAQHLAVPHVRKPKPLVVAREYAVAVRGRDQLARGPEPAVDVFKRTLGEAEGEGGADIVGRGDLGPSVFEHGPGLTDPASRDEIVEQARQMTGADDVRDIRQQQRRSTGVDPDLG
jgi:hypothetical protein